MIDFKQNPFKMRLNGSSSGGESRLSRSCLRARLVFRWKSWAELTDVLRKRRNRPDASDEDLGLPRSPASPQRHAAAGQSRKTAGYQSRVATQGHEVSSLSLLSSNSTDGEDSSQSHRQLMCKSMSSDILRSHAPDEQVDGVSLDRQRLSHAAAKHKMAIRPAKKKGPSRQHRRTLESSIPEANEELAKFGQTPLQNPSLRAVKETDLKSKTRSLPPGSSLTATSNVTATATNSTSTSNSSSISSSHMRSKTIEQKKATTITTINSSSSSSNSNSNNKSEQHMTSTSSTSTTSSSAFGLRALTFKAANSLFDGRGESSTDGDDISSQPTDSDPGFLRRLMQRNSKRSIARANDGVEDLDATHNVAKKLQISTSCLEATQREPIPVPNKSKSATSHEQHIQETRQNIKREIQQEGKHGLNAMVSNYGVHPQPPTAVKPKSGPAARQRYLPQELAQHENTASDVTSLLSKQSRGNDTFQSTALVREQTQLKTTEIATTTSTTTTSTHFERKPRIVGLSAFQQKLSRSSDSMGQHSSSSNSLETSTDEPSPLYYEEKQRKMVEKSRSFRNYQEERESSAHETLAVHNNMPSLPDLSISFRVPASYYSKQQLSSPSPQSPMSPMSPMSPSAKCASLGFEINDNKLLQARAESTGKLPSPAKLSPQRSTTLLVSNTHPTPSASSTSISQIEQNIDLIVKSPLISVLRKSGAVNEQVSLEQQQQPPQRPKVLELKQTTSIAIKEPKPASSPPSTPGKATTQAETQPEFMKIQLNRVDQARLHNKSNHLVLAKNVKSPAERSQSSDDLSMRRLSGDSTGSIQIVERSPTKTATPASPSPAASPAAAITPHSISQQQRAVSANSLRSSYVSTSSGSSAGSSELLAASPSTPKKPVEIVDSVQSNRFSLEERKRLFLNEDKAQTDRKLVELRYERKKSINEELQRKTETAAATPVSPISPVSPVTPVTPVSPGDQSNGNVVVLRKKSFASSNNGNSNSLTATATPIAAAANSQEDGTPELMKVFARRSLKVKDDDAVAMAQVAVATHKKITNGSQSVDSDKENHSNSEEKLDKMLPKYEAQLSLETPRNHAQSHAPVQTQSSVSNRSSVADFRNLNNNQQPTGQKLANLPPIKVSNVRNNNTNVANNKTNSQSHSPSVKSANERYSLQLKQATPATVAVTATATVAATVKSTAVEAETEATPTKAIERSATVGEFKGILQRRAEWEQRVKEALK
ncbi:serine-rich adhesin for platelets isoform X2 [Drosophila nasuta]|uniref:serine-rich adhesin for platelets isoform X2 n=1 Tax=Drosophila nasuta TaxID=42062 RepID=UPI00295E20E8|nr:serine-rich adhesin for platelets isoform X2 [Drosophila nasuta]